MIPLLGCVEDCWLDVLASPLNEAEHPSSSASISDPVLQACLLAHRIFEQVLGLTIKEVLLVGGSRGDKSVVMPEAVW
jgi:hypothetical protein